MVQKKVPDYLLPMIDDYLSDRWVICEGAKWSLKEEMTCGAPQGSRVGPLVWNVMYDDLLRLDVPAGTRIIGFTDDALVVTDRRSSQYPRILLGEHEVKWKTSIKYLGLQFNRRLSFGEHLQTATPKAIQCEANFARVKPKIDGTSEEKRRLVASVVHSKLLYAAPVWANAVQNHAI